MKAGSGRAVGVDVEGGRGSGGVLGLGALVGVVLAVVGRALVRVIDVVVHVVDGDRVRVGGVGRDQGSAVGVDSVDSVVGVDSVIGLDQSSTVDIGRVGSVDSDDSVVGDLISSGQQILGHVTE